MPLRSFALRLLLLLLLPGIAVVLYLKGQKYDPSLVDFKPAGQAVSIPSMELSSSSGAMSADRPEKAVAGYLPAGRPRTFTKDNLYEHVNGHAEYFISAGFLGLTVTEYAAAGGTTLQPVLQAEVYDMGSSIQAFGVLSDEAGDNARPVQAGSMGFGTSGGINFIQGRYYVKIAVLDTKIRPLAFAQAYGRSLPAGADSFDIFARLPKLGKVLKTRFIKEGYRGLDILRNVLERQYQAEQGTITLALLASEQPEKARLEAALLEYFKKSGMSHEKARLEGRDYYRVSDRYEGDWLLIPDKNALYGLFGTEDASILKNILNIKAPG